MPSPVESLPTELDRPFQLLVFDWDGTAVADRHADTGRVRALLAALLDGGVRVIVVTGTSFENIDRQLLEGLDERQGLAIATDRGSTLWRFDRAGRPIQVVARRATPEEDARLTSAVEAARDAIAARVSAPLGVVYDRPNRRKLDLLPDWPNPPKAAIDALLDRVEERLMGIGGLAGAVHLTAEASEGLRLTTDAKHVEIGLTDKGDAVAAAVASLAPDIEACDVLVVGDEFGPLGGWPGSDLRMLEAMPGAVAVSVGVEPRGVPPGVRHLPGGPDAFLRVLAAQRDALTRTGPLPTAEPGWRVEVAGIELLREHEVESILAVSNGRLGVRASLGEGSAMSAAATFVAGAFTGNPVPRLMTAPDWTRLVLSVEGRILDAASAKRHRRILDLRQGILWREWVDEDPAGRRTRVRAARAASLADRDLAFESVEVLAENWSGTLGVDATLSPPWEPSGPGTWSSRPSGPVPAVFVEARVPGASGEGRWDLPLTVGGAARFERTFALGRMRPAEAGPALHAHARAWEHRWRDAEIEVDGDPSAERALRFAAFHLLAAADPRDAGTAPGARLLTGPAYLGHVFWEADVYMLPFYVCAWPEAARAVLEYRRRTLPAARARAAARGWRGALFAWESADSGDDVTPRVLLAPDGSVQPVRTGELEHHVVADVAWAAWRYWTATADDAFLAGIGAELATEAARFWASRGQSEADGKFHVRHVIGPDEWHEDVDDDAYTNLMAARALEWGAEVADWLRARGTPAPEEAEVQDWRRKAATVAVSTDGDGVIEQFAGYFALDDVDLAERPAEAPSLELAPGRARTRAVKQADVVLLLHLLEDRFPEPVRLANYRWYVRRTGQGSSLSPPAHAVVAARLGLGDEALAWFRRTAEIDLEPGNSAGGVHAGALGGLWQAAVLGFAGLRLDGDAPRLEPRLPPGWRAMRFPFRFRGRRWTATVEGAHGHVEEAP